MILTACHGLCLHCVHGVRDKLNKAAEAGLLSTRITAWKIHPKVFQV